MKNRSRLETLEMPCKKKIGLGQRHCNWSISDWWVTMLVLEEYRLSHIQYAISHQEGMVNHAQSLKNYTSTLRNKRR